MSSFASRIAGQQVRGTQHNFPGQQRYTKALSGLNIKIKTVQILLPLRQLQYQCFTFWKLESHLAEAALAKAFKLKGLKPNRLKGYNHLADTLENHTKKLDSVITRLNDTERFAALGKFEEILDNFKTIAAAAGDFLGPEEKEAKDAGKWASETDALREKLADLSPILKTTKNEFLENYSLDQLIELTNYLANEAHWLVEETERLAKLIEADVFNPLRYPQRMFGRLVSELNATKEFIKKYRDEFQGNKYWLAESKRLCLELLIEAARDLESCRKAALAEVDQETLTAMDSLLQLHANNLSAERERLTPLVQQDIFGRLAKREKAQKLLEEELAEFDDLFPRLSAQFKGSYSWALASEKIKLMIAEAEKILTNSRFNSYDRNKLVKAIKDLKSIRIVITQELERLRPLLEETAEEEFINIFDGLNEGIPEINLAAEQPAQKEADTKTAAATGLAGTVKTISQRVDAFAAMKNELEKMFAKLEREKQRFQDICTASPSTPPLDLSDLMNPSKTRSKDNNQQEQKHDFY